MAEATKVPPLEIRTLKIPQGAQSVERGSLDVLKTVLNNLDLKGLWTVSFIKQTTKKSDIRFQFVREEGHVIRVRTKPADNGSVWELLLRPPLIPVYSIPDISKKLKTIHPKKLILPSTNGHKTEQPKASIPAPRETLPSPPPAPVIPLTKLEAVHVMQAELDEVDAEIAARAATSIDPVEPELSMAPPSPPKPPPPPPPPPPTWRANAETQDLSLDYHRVDSLTKDEYVLSRGLIALAVFAKIPGVDVIPIRVATTVLTKQLGLEKFVANHDRFKSLTNAKRLIVKGLVDNGYLARAENTEMGVTKTLALTDLAWKTVEEWNGIPKNDGVAARVWDDEDEGISPEDFHVAPTPVPVSASAPTELAAGTVEKLRANFTDIQKLLAEHEKATETLQTFDSLLVEARAKVEAAVDAGKGVSQEIATLEIQLTSLKAKAAGYEKTKTDAEGEVRDLLAERAAEEQRANEIKTKLERIMS